MVKKEKRQSQPLTLADQRRALARLVSERYCSTATGNSAGSLPAQLPGASDAELPAATSADATLGLPLDIRATARLIGCSPWTVRQKLLPKGLPHFRSGASGKLIFYEAQVIRWVERRQQTGGGKHR